MAHLLQAAMKRGITLIYVRQLLACFGKAQDRTPVNQDLVEPLSDRERDVLRLLPTLLPNTEIAGELFVSVNTVKTHLKAIYRKLDAPGRREAVGRAREAGLLPH